jgi:hypothetical protein
MGSIVHMKRRTALLVVFALAAWLVAAPSYGAMRLVGAAPSWTAEDVAGPNTPRASLEVTFSPNGDGIRDVAVVAGCVPAGTVPMLAAFYRHRRRRIELVATVRRPPRLVRLGASPRCARGEQLWRGSWNGAAVINVEPHRPQGSYWLTLCARIEDGVPVAPPVSPFVPDCAARPVLARLRSVWVRLPWTRSIVAGRQLPIRIETDARQVDVTITDADGAAPAIRRRGVDPTSVHPMLQPRLPAGIYRVRVRAGTVEVDMPITVRSPTPLDAPPPNTALIVAPSLTWLAYDRADEDRDGTADSWYAVGPAYPGRGVSLDAPLLTLQADSAEEDHAMWQPFFAWLDSASRSYQVVTDVELASLDPAVLARYASIWFPGHTEYYTPTLYARLLAYRDAGGDLAFLSSNNIYRMVRIDWSARRVVPAWDTATPCACTRDSRRSDYSITGTGFAELDLDPPSTMHVAPGATEAAPWLFTGTGLAAGDTLGFGGLELDGPPPPDHPAAASFHVILEGTVRGRPVVSGLSTYATSARTFSAGNEDFVVDTLDGAIPPAERAALLRLLDNLWTEFAR